MRTVHGINGSTPTKTAFMSAMGSSDDVEFARDFASLISLPDQTVSSVTAVADPEYDDLEWLLGWRSL